MLWTLHSERSSLSRVANNRAMQAEVIEKLLNPIESEVTETRDSLYASITCEPYSPGMPSPYRETGATTTPSCLAYKECGVTGFIAPLSMATKPCQLSL